MVNKFIFVDFRGLIAPITPLDPPLVSIRVHPAPLVLFYYHRDLA